MKGPTNSSARPNIRLLNVSATFVSNPDTSNNTEFPFRASIQADGVSEYMSATVMFSQIQAISGNFATYCQTDEDVVYIYSKTDVGTITIPAVSCDLSVNYINVDNVPTEDSQAVITSGGVYDALGDYVTKNTAQTITATKTHKQPLHLLADNSDPYFMISSNFPRVAGKNLNDLISTNGMLYQEWGYDSTDWGYVQRDLYRRGNPGSGLTPTTEVHQYIRNKQGKSIDFNIYLEDGANGDGYMRGPSRTYNTANTTDIVTIGAYEDKYPYIMALLTIPTVPGLTITPRDSMYGITQSYRVIRCGRVIVANVDMNITGTYTGSDNWVDIYTVPSSITRGETIDLPYMTVLNNNLLLWGSKMYLVNGQAVSTWVTGQVVMMVE